MNLIDKVQAQFPKVVKGYGISQVFIDEHGELNTVSTWVLPDYEFERIEQLLVREETA